MTNTKTCPICAKAVDASRLAKYPNAVVCGRRTCTLKYRRAAFNKIRRRYRDKRLASDPVFRLLEKQRARERYVKSRLRIGKTPALRGPVATEQRATDTLRGRAVGALRAVWAAISAIPRNGRALGRAASVRVIGKALNLARTR